MGEGGGGAMITPRLICQASWPLHKLAAQGRKNPLKYIFDLCQCGILIYVTVVQEDANLPVGINGSRFFHE